MFLRENKWAEVVPQLNDIYLMWEKFRFVNPASIYMRIS